MEKRNDVFDSFYEKKSRDKVEETHTRTTFLMRNDLLNKVNSLSTEKGRGFKTHFFNQAVENLLKEIE
ncbi:hypothetical protein [Neobacillus mesonae]|uniref:hypothetical protein n=1 Tax=Neobacillus mesonae TaxID=1193713 RepID=UPI000832027A|nr:hypothetical protein [Neobacillus mesonae]